MHPPTGIPLLLLLSSLPGGALSFLSATEYPRRSVNAPPPRGSASCASDRSGSLPPGVGLASGIRYRDAPSPERDEEDGNDPDPCPDPLGDDPSLDRREAAFAAIGALWAGTATAMAAFPLYPEAAGAAYGSDAKIELPNPIETATNRAMGRQCLVETLGNRECLAYMDEGNKLYQGAESRVLLGRIEALSEALASIPDLVSEKKWSKVLGVLTGPMGSLGGTMDQLGKMSAEEGGEGSAEAATRVKNDLYAIAAGVEQKDGAVILKYHGAATEDLVSFVKTL